MPIYVNPSLTTGANDGTSAANALQTGDLTSYSGSGNEFLIAASTFATAHRTGISWGALTGTNTFDVYDPEGGSNATVWVTGRKTVSGSVNTTGDIYEVTGIGATAPTAAVWAYTQDDASGTTTGVSQITVNGTSLPAAYGFLVEGTFDSLNEGEWAYDAADGGTLQIRRAGTDTATVDANLEYCLQETAFDLSSCDDVEFADDTIWIGDCFPDGATSRNNYCGLKLEGCNSVLAYGATFLARNAGYRFHGDVGAGNDGGHRIGAVGGIGIQTDHGTGNTTPFCAASYSTQAAADTLDSRWGVNGGIVFKPHPHLGTTGAPIRNFATTEYQPIGWYMHGNGSDLVGGVHLYDFDFYYPQAELNTAHTLTMAGFSGYVNTAFGHMAAFTQGTPSTYPIQVHGGSFHGRSMNQWLSAASKTFGLRGVWHDRVDIDNAGIVASVNGSGNSSLAIVHIQANTGESEPEHTAFTSCNFLSNMGSTTAGRSCIYLWGDQATVILDGCNMYDTLTGTVTLRSHLIYWNNSGAGLDTVNARACCFVKKTDGSQLFRANNVDMTGNFTTESCLFDNQGTTNFILNGQGTGNSVTAAEWQASFDTGTCVYSQDPGWNDPDSGDFSFIAGGGGYIENNEHTDIAGLANVIGFNDEAYSGTYGSYQQGGLFVGAFDASSSNVQANGTQIVLYWDAPAGDWATAVGADILRNTGISPTITADGSPVSVTGVVSSALAGDASTDFLVAYSLGSTITQGQTVAATISQGGWVDLNDKVTGAASASEITNNSTQEAAASGGGAARNRSRSRARASALA